VLKLSVDRLTDGARLTGVISQRVRELTTEKIALKKRLNI
jgi:hypothetical protein